MGFIVLPALIPDIASVYDVYFTAFKDSPILSALFPMGVDSGEFRDAHTAHTRSYWEKSSTQYTLKCVDSETGGIVGMALWDVYVTPSDWKKGEVDWLSGKEKERAEKLLFPLWDMREKLWDGKRYVYCHVIATHPQYQRRGIGSLLTQAGIQIAQQSQLPIYLESTKSGQPLYAKLGFKLLKETIVHEKGALGEGSEEERVPLMVWEPGSLSTGLEFVGEGTEIGEVGGKFDKMKLQDNSQEVINARKDSTQEDDGLLSN
ncbi:hypothetical protein K469DRAFT_745115 [Zopfia rhizophila CBS 207.26]|uniref:N-acetyltransferase domain-containing protein n=1 Tax=Zopfia rhizophila CBS 207.26 TaxID=1314779 RepID=A0A6A6ER83_9PEZI|nr:hypothetical protein K469DRAFT_745115 [Zopfia rhizophila CBS 207.26]